MERPPRHGDLEIPADERHDRIEARLEHVGWLLWVLALLAGVLGLLGPGPLSLVEVADPSGQLHVRYHKLQRHEAAAELDLDVRARPGADGLVHLWLGRQLGEHGEVTGIEPPPERTETVGDRVVRSFRVQGDGPLGSVRVRWRPTGVGAVELQAGVGQHPGLALPLYVLP